MVNVWAYEDYHLIALSIAQFCIELLHQSEAARLHASSKGLRETLTLEDSLKAHGLNRVAEA